jgi:hypothetical protein
VENVLIQLRKLRLQYEKLRKKIDAQEWNSIIWKRDNL